MENDDILVIILCIIYFICVGIEIKVLKKNKIEIFYKENFSLILLICSTIPLAIVALLIFCNILKDILSDSELVLASGYFLTFIFASLAYIIHYIKSRIYALISSKNKLKILNTKTIYHRKNNYK